MEELLKLIIILIVIVIILLMEYLHLNKIMDRLKKTRGILLVLVFTTIFSTACKNNNLLDQQDDSLKTNKLICRENKDMKVLFISYLDSKEKRNINDIEEKTTNYSAEEKEELLIDKEVKNQLGEVIKNSNCDEIQALIELLKDADVLNDYRFFMVNDLLVQLREEEGKLEYFKGENNSQEVDKIKKDIGKLKESITSVFTSEYKFIPSDVEKMNYELYDKVMWDKITASSQLYSEENAYNPKLVQDFRLETAWVEGREGNGIGEWIKFDSDYPKFVYQINIFNGYRKSLDLYNANTVPVKVKIEFSDGTTIYRELEDDFNGDNIINLDKEVFTSYIKITIIDVREGSNYSDTCISEIDVRDLNCVSNNSKNHQVLFKTYMQTSNSYEGNSGLSFHLNALNNKGKIIWEKVWDNLSIGQFPVASECAISEDGTVYIEVGAKLYAFDLYSGEEKWGGVNVGCLDIPVIDSDGTIYCTAFDGPASLTALSSDGTIKWQKGPGGTYKIKFKDELIYVFSEYRQPGERDYMIFDKDGNIIAE